ncbi:MAG: hypothetical protein ACXWPM_05090 [Bdellovibrionota bacterium]
MRFRPGISAIFSCVILAIALSACGDQTSVKGVLGVAVTALEKKDLASWNELLDPQIRGQFGNLTELQRLSKEIAGYELSIGEGAEQPKEAFVSQDFQGSATLHQVYEVEILRAKKNAKPEILRSIQIHCLTDAADDSTPVSGAKPLCLILAI